MKPAEVIRKLERILENTELGDGDPNSVLYAARQDVQDIIAHLRARRGEPRRGDISAAKRIGQHLGHQIHTNPLYQQDPAAKDLAISAASYARQLEY
jgi:hypothetical protein